MSKRFSSRGLSKHRSYTLEEAASIIGASDQTLRKWGKDGELVIMKSRRPHMVHGLVLAEYLESRKPKKRPPFAPGEFDCWSCKRRGKPFGMMADYVTLTDKTGYLSALCGHCEESVSQIIGQARLLQYAAILEITNNGTC